MSFKLIDHNRDKEKGPFSRAEAEERKNDMVGLGAKPEDLEIKPMDGGAPESVESDGGNPQEVPETVPAEVPKSKPTVDEDPVDWMPTHFVDEIQGVPTVNRKGYAVIASQFNVSVVAEPVTLASETDFEYAEFQAKAVTENGEEYSGFGSAHVERMDGDDEYLLNELAETRAMKRATAWATGVGMTAIEEMKGEL